MLVVGAHSKLRVLQMSEVDSFAQKGATWAPYFRYAELTDGILRVGLKSLAGLNTESEMDLDTLNGDLKRILRINGNYQSEIPKTSYIELNKGCSMLWF